MFCGKLPISLLRVKPAAMLDLTDIKSLRRHFLRGHIINSDPAMICSKCGFKNPKGMRFCGHCAAPPKQACPACSFINPPGFSYCGQCAGKLSGSSTSPKSSHKAERRQLTVLFCDIVGSSALSEGLDPEELQDIIHQYRSVCSKIIANYDGHVAQYLGDGILVYFGYPMAHEDDTKRAARAALDIVSEVPRIYYTTNNGETAFLAVRAGIHTGLVVIGDMGNGDKRSLALGKTPNVAARIQDCAKSNSVVISEASKRLLGNLFHCTPLGQRQLRGFSHPQEIFQLEPLEITLKDRQLTQSLTCTPIIGREQETALLAEKFNLVRKGIGQVTLLSGEPGVGKTRLAQWVCEQVKEDDCRLLQCSATAYFQNSYLFPIIDLLRREFSLHKHVTNEGKLQQIEKNIGALGLDTFSMAPILAELLSIPLNEQYLSAAESTPQQKKQKTLGALLLIIKTLAQQRLVLLIVEDLHWVDASTLELLTQLAGQPDLGNIFVVLTFRKEFMRSWPLRTHLTKITLNRLTRQQCGHLIRELCQQKILPLSVTNEIINRTDGIPFFIEELTSALLESNLLQKKSGHYELSTPIAELGIPSTLQDLLMSRLDNLGDEKELAQISATLGREFDHEVLRVISSRDEKSFTRGLDHLLSAELFLQHGERPKAWYQFRHALLREAAYQSLLKRTRQKYHQRIATLLKQHFPKMIRENPELLARHCTEAGNFREALEYWLKAGHISIQNSANIEAIAHLKQGLMILEALPESAEKNTAELALQTCLGQAFMMTRGYAAPEVENAYARAKELSKDITDIAIVFPVLCGLWEYYVVRADLQAAYELACEINKLAQTTQQPSLMLEAQRAMGTSQLWRGNLADARQHLTPGKLINDGEDPSRPTNLLSYCQDARVATLANTGCILWLSGDTDEAMASAHQAVRLATQLRHPFSQAYALHFLCTLSQLRGDLSAITEHAEAQIVLCKTYGFSFWGAMGEMFLAWTNAGSGPLGSTIKAFQQALNDYEKCGSRIARSYFLAMFASLQHQAGDINAASKTIETTLQEISTTGEEFFKSELLRIKGELLMAYPKANFDTVETVFKQALGLAHQQEAHSLALRVACSLANLMFKQNKTAPIKKLLQTHLGRIKGGESTQDIITAQKLLRRCSVQETES